MYSQGQSRQHLHRQLHGARAGHDRPHDDGHGDARGEQPGLEQDERDGGAERPGQPGGSGVKQITYSLAGAQSGGGVLPGSGGAVTITGEGTTTLLYFATDNAGNVEATNTLVVRA